MKIISINKTNPTIKAVETLDVTKIVVKEQTEINNFRFIFLIFFNK